MCVCVFVCMHVCVCVARTRVVVYMICIVWGMHFNLRMLAHPKSCAHEHAWHPCSVSSVCCVVHRYVCVCVCVHYANIVVRIVCMHRHSPAFLECGHGAMYMNMGCVYRVYGCAHWTIVNHNTHLLSLTIP